MGVTLMKIFKFGTICCALLWVCKKYVDRKNRRRQQQQHTLAPPVPVEDDRYLPVPKIYDYFGWKVVIDLAAVRVLNANPLDRDVPQDRCSLQEFSTICEVYFICKVDEESQLKELQELLMQQFWSYKMVPHRILGYSTAAGKQAIVRQISPSIAIIDNDVETVTYLKKHIPHVVLVDFLAPPPALFHGGYTTTNSFAHYLQAAAS
eukprot:PhF_6_TR38992/c0_g1_i1/m.58345